MVACSLSATSIAKIEARAHELLANVQRRAKEEVERQTARTATLQAEVRRLADAIAEMGLSPALRKRLAQAEAELALLSADVTEQNRSVTPAAKTIRARIREVAMQLEAAFAADVCKARAILQQKLGDIIVEEKDDGVFAQMDIGPVLLAAVGADVAKTGCGGRI